MRLPRRPTGAPPGLSGSLASGLSARAASALLAALLATGTPRPWRHWAGPRDLNRTNGR